jgi:hypothetical protein
MNNIARVPTFSDAEIRNQISIYPATFPRTNCRWDGYVRIADCLGPVAQTVWNYTRLDNPLCIKGSGNAGTVTATGTRLDNVFVYGATYSVNLTIIFQNGRQVRCTGLRITIPDAGNCDMCRRGKSSAEDNPNALINIYPNPTSSAISIESNEFNINKIEIYDAVGKLCLQQQTELTNNFYLDVSKLEQGFYFVKIYDKNDTLLETQKLLIQK